MDNNLVEQRVEVLRQTVVSLVRREGPDLSARQLGVFLTCYFEEEAQTVRGLAAKLNISKPAITRALDRLAEFDLVRRFDDFGRGRGRRLVSGATASGQQSHSTDRRDDAFFHVTLLMSFLGRVKDTL